MPTAADPGPRPRLVVPPKSCECHSHIYGPLDKYPYAAGAGRSLHPDASVADYRAVMDNLGIERYVIVQPSAYGTDNSRTLGAMRELGSARARGVAVCRADVSHDALQALHDAGIRGFRFTRQGNDVTLDDMPAVMPRIAPFGWHVQVQADGEDAAEWLPRLRDLPVPVVVDHIGRMPKNMDLDDPRFVAFLKLLETGNMWVKISGPYYGSVDGAPYLDVVPRIRKLAEVRPDRLVWALNWPHPQFPADGKPVPADCLDILLVAFPDDAAIRQAILADNPARLYDFPD
jgi:D-galactarolactone isomerase